jgi:hypothetical protein
MSAPPIVHRLSAAERSKLLKEDQTWVGKAFDIAVSPRALQANTRHMALTLLDTQMEYRASRAAAFAETLIGDIMNPPYHRPHRLRQGAAIAAIPTARRSSRF